MVDNDAPDRLLPPMAWNAWGDPDAAKPLSDGIRGLLEQALDVTPASIPAPGIDEVQLRPSALTDIHGDGLTAIVGDDYLRTGNRERLLYAGGKSTPDLLRRKQTRQDAPDAVLLPADEDQIAAVLAYCSHHGIAVVPFGGGTSVVGGLDPIRGEFGSVISLDLRRLDELHWLDETSIRPNSARASPDPTPSGCWANSVSRWATSRRASCSPPSAASRAPAPRARIPPATGGSTT